MAVVCPAESLIWRIPGQGMENGTRGHAVWKPAMCPAAACGVVSPLVKPLEGCSGAELGLSRNPTLFEPVRQTAPLFEPHPLRLRVMLFHTLLSCTAGLCGSGHGIKRARHNESALKHDLLSARPRHVR